MNTEHTERKNVLGGELVPCCTVTKTGFFRDGYCRTDFSDVGQHVVCALMSEEFLIFTKQRGNDLSTPRPEFSFPGLKVGDRWCLCATRWLEAWEEGAAPPVILEACSEEALQVIPLRILQQFAH